MPSTQIYRSLVFFILLASTPFISAEYVAASSRSKCASYDSSSAPTDGPTAALRNLMKQLGLGAYVVPGVDQHMSEYIGDYDKRRQWLTKFTGSAGVAIVTPTEAVLWTDGRYLLQSESELDCQWGILKMKPYIWTWAVEHLRDVKIGADPKLFSKLDWEGGADILSAAKGTNLTLTGVPSLVDRLWGSGGGIFGDRPARHAKTTTAVQPLRYAGVSWEEKVTHLRSEMNNINADYLVVLDLMEIAWLLNLRGKDDIPYNPVFYSFLLLPKEKGRAARLFIGPNRVDAEHLRPDCDGKKFQFYVDETTTEGANAKADFCPSSEVVAEDYDKFYDAVDQLVNEEGSTSKFWFSSRSNYAIFRAIPASRQILTPPTPLRALKAIKNPIETEGMKSAHVKDALALITFAAALEKRVENEIEPPWTEIDVAVNLANYRAKQDGSRGESFPTIAGFDANGAIIHYDPTKNSKPAVLNSRGEKIHCGREGWLVGILVQSVTSTLF